MTEGIIIAIITGGMAIFSNIIVAWAQNSKTVYRIEQLEKKVDKHNKVIERTYVLEGEMRETRNDIKALKAYHQPQLIE